MTAKFIQMDGVEMNTEETIINLLQRVRVLEQAAQDQSELIDIMLNRLGYLENRWTRHLDGSSLHINSWRN